MVATTAVGLAVMELEPFPFTTSQTVLGNESAPPLIMLVDGSLDRVVKVPIKRKKDRSIWAGLNCCASDDPHN